MLETERLLLRGWREADLAPFAELNGDARVMQYLPRLLTRRESDQLATRLEEQLVARGFSFWAVEIKRTHRFAGFVGLSAVSFAAHFTPCVEIGWRLSYEHWGHGYATEAARAALALGFDRLQLPEIVAFSVPANLRSRRVMERLGMTRLAADDFEHPRLPAGDPLRAHVLYRAGPSSQRGNAYATT
ncbi:MAG TPA: GNAT family N-acetyltransferase [Steroidobacteraceae bacterium]|nr:GNAT family N-acetyltransferase [Steroidobacteraceae bacterium]